MKFTHLIDLLLLAFFCRPLDMENSCKTVLHYWVWLELHYCHHTELDLMLVKNLVFMFPATYITYRERMHTTLRFLLCLDWYLKTKEQVILPNSFSIFKRRRYDTILCWNLWYGENLFVQLKNYNDYYYLKKKRSYFFGIYCTFYSYFNIHTSVLCFIVKKSFFKHFFIGIFSIILK